MEAHQSESVEPTARTPTARTACVVAHEQTDDQDDAVPNIDEDVAVPNIGEDIATRRPLTWMKTLRSLTLRTWRPLALMKTL